MPLYGTKGLQILFAEMINSHRQVRAFQMGKFLALFATLASLKSFHGWLLEEVGSEVTVTV